MRTASMHIHKHDYSIDGLRVAYRVYLEAKYPKLKPKSIKTKVDDVFAVVGWIGLDRFTNLMSFEPEHLDVLCGHYANTYLSNRKNPMKDAKGYIRALKEFRVFLDVVLALEMGIQYPPRKIEPSKATF